MELRLFKKTLLTQSRPKWNIEASRGAQSAKFVRRRTILSACECMLYYVVEMEEEEKGPREGGTDVPSSCPDRVPAGGS